MIALNLHKTLEDAVAITGVSNLSNAMHANIWDTNPMNALAPKRR